MEQVIFDIVGALVYLVGLSYIIIDTIKELGQ